MKHGWEEDSLEPERAARIKKNVMREIREDPDLAPDNPAIDVWSGAVVAVLVLLGALAASVAAAGLIKLLIWVVTL